MLARERKATRAIVTSPEEARSAKGRRAEDAWFEGNPTDAQFDGPFILAWALAVFGRQLCRTRPAPYGTRAFLW